MARVSVSIPDDVVARAKASGLNISQLATRALEYELARIDRGLELDRYLADLEAELGPIPEDEASAASRWADQLSA